MKPFNECSPEEQRALYPNACRLADAINATPNPQRTFERMKAIITLKAQEVQEPTNDR